MASTDARSPQDPRRESSRADDPTKIYDDNAPTPSLSSDELDTSEMLSRPIENIGDYKIIRKLGGGTYGDVYLAHRSSDQLHHLYAVKVLSRTDEEGFSQLRREAEVIRLFEKQVGIVQLKEAEPHHEFPYYVMPYYEEGSLAYLIRESVAANDNDGRALPVHQATQIFRALTTALADVHDKGISHCDLKPHNILLDEKQCPAIADFGQARLSELEGPALGTWFYMPPEQADIVSPSADCRCDVYALGAVFYEMVTGKKPRWSDDLNTQLTQTTLRASDRLQIYRQALQDADEPKAHRYVPGMDKSLARVIDRCLQLDPEKRLPNARSVLDALDRVEEAKLHRKILVAGLALPTLLLAIMLTVAVLDGRGRISKARETYQDLVDADTVRIIGQFKERLAVARDLVDAYAQQWSVHAWRARDESPEAVREHFHAMCDDAVVRLDTAFGQTGETSDNSASMVVRGLDLFDPTGVLVADGAPEARKVTPEYEQVNDVIGAVYSFREYFCGDRAETIEFVAEVDFDAVALERVAETLVVSPDVAPPWNALPEGVRQSLRDGDGDALAAALNATLDDEVYFAKVHADSTMRELTLQNLHPLMRAFVDEERWNKREGATRDKLRRSCRRLQLRELVNTLAPKGQIVKPQRMIQRTRASAPFESSVSGRPIFCVSTPLTGGSAAQGVMALFFELSDLGAWLDLRPDTRLLISVDGEPVLHIDESGNVVDNAATLETITSRHHQEQRRGELVKAHRSFVALPTVALEGDANHAPSTWSVDVYRPWHLKNQFKSMLIGCTAVGVVLVGGQWWLLRWALVSRRRRKDA